MSIHTYTCANSSTVPFINGNQCLHRRQGIVLKNKIVKVTKDKNNMVRIHVYRNDKVGSRARHTGGRLKKHEWLVSKITPGFWSVIPRKM